RPESLMQQAPAASKVAAEGTREEAPALTRITQLRGLRVNIDQPGSGVPELVQRLLKANGLGLDALTTSQLGPAAAVEALQGGLIDAMVLVTAPESPVIGQLLHAPGVALMDVAQADA